MPAHSPAQNNCFKLFMLFMLFMQEDQLHVLCAVSLVQCRPSFTPPSFCRRRGRHHGAKALSGFLDIGIPND
jgi:hypothetical protein